MELIKSVIEFIISGAQRVDVDAVFGLLIFYLAVVAALFLIRIVKGVGSWSS